MTFPGLLKLDIEGFVGISPEVVWGCYTGGSEAEIFPGLSFGVIILEGRGFCLSGKLYPSQFLNC